MKIQSLKKQYPFDQGYVHAKLTLHRDTPLTDEALRRVATGGKPDEYEIPHIEQRGKVITAITRHKSRKPAD